MFKNLLNKTLNFNFMGQYNNRSSKRTDIMNESFMETYMSIKGFDNDPDYEIVPEKKIKCFHGRDFKIDAILYYKGKIKKLFLLKMNQTSIIKNLLNSQNTKAGEIIRVTGSPQIDKFHDDYDIIFVDFLPETTYTVLKSNTEFKIEEVRKRFMCVPSLTDHPLFGSVNLHEVKIWYKPTKSFFNTIKLTKRDKLYDNYGSDFIDSIDEEYLENLP